MSSWGPKRGGERSRQQSQDTRSSLLLPHRALAHRYLPRVWAMHQHCRTMSAAGSTRLAACSARGLHQNQTGLIYPRLGWDHALLQPFPCRAQLPAPPERPAAPGHPAASGAGAISASAAQEPGTSAECGDSPALCQHSRGLAAHRGRCRRELEQTRKWERDKGPCFEPTPKPHRQLQVQKPQGSLAASCSPGQRAASPSARHSTALGKGEERIYLCQGCAMQKPALGRFISRSRPSPQHAASETGRSSDPLSEGSNRNQSIRLAAGGSAACGGGWQGNSCRASPSIAGVSGAAGPRGGDGRAGLGLPPRGWDARPPSTLPTSQACSEPRCRVCLVLYPITAKRPKTFLINAKLTQTAPAEEWEVPAPAVAELLCAWGPAETWGQRSQLLR